MVTEQSMPPTTSSTQPPRPRNMVEALPATGVPVVAQAGIRQDVFSLAEGPVTIQWPASLSQNSYQDVADWLEIVKRKIGRSVTGEIKIGVSDSLRVTDEK